MRATFMYGAGDVRVIDVPDPTLQQPTDALVRVVQACLDCVGHRPAYKQALGVARVGGVISRVGVPQYEDGDIGWNLFGRNLTLTGGPAPVRAYIDELMPDILDGRYEPGKVFDRTVTLEQTPEGYAAMDRRDALKVLVKP